MPAESTDHSEASDFSRPGVVLRLLRRRLSRQYQFLKEGRMPEALALDEVLGQMLPGLRELNFPAGPQSELLIDLQAQCARLTDSIHPYLEHETKLISREWVELQVDQELSRLARDPGLPPKTARQTTIRQ